MEKYDSIANIASAGSHRVNMEREEWQMSSLFFGSLESVCGCGGVYVCGGGVVGVGVCVCVCRKHSNIYYMYILFFSTLKCLTATEIQCDSTYGFFSTVLSK